MTHRTIVFADRHKSVFVCAALDSQTGEIEHRTLKARRAEVEPFLRSLEGPVLLYVEACRGWGWVEVVAEECGIEFRLVNPREMPEIARSTKKSDRRDVEGMLNRFQAASDLPRSRFLNRGERALRAISRERGTLADIRRKILLRIHALIDCQDLPAKNQMFKNQQWREEMAAAPKEDEWFLLQSLLMQLDQVDDHIERLSKRLVELAEASPHYERIKSIPGFGPVLTSTVLAELPDVEGFRSARQLAAFIGLTPSVRSSAGKARYGRITKCGPPHLRWAITQAVVISGRCKVESDISLFFKRKKAKGKPPKVAISAAANKLARAIYAMMKNETEFSLA